MAQHTPEITAISDFLATCVPFDALDPALRREVAGEIEIVYFRAGSPIDPPETGPCLSIVRGGAVDVREADGELIDRCGPGDTFGAGTLLIGAARNLRVTALEDSLLYRLPGERFHRLRAADRDFERYFHGQQARRLRRAVYTGSGNQQLVRRVADVMARNVVACDSATTVHEAARRMSEQRVSSLLVIDGGRLMGIVTDRDLRTRAVARGLDTSRPVTEIMTASPHSVSADGLVFDALMAMSERDVHHLPVLQDGQVVGVLTATDLLRAQRHDPVYVIHEISRARNSAELEPVQEALRAMLRHWVDGGARAFEVGRMLTSVSDAIARRLIALGIEALGPPPVAWAWLGFGSQGRAEQALGADQDNALLLAPDYDGARHGDYFASLAERVCHGLAACGYRLCPGEIMAANPKWRQSLPGWQKTFGAWIDEPTPKALMHSSIFFDMRCIAGDAQLVEALQGYVLEHTPKNSIFLACLYSNVMTHTPPLGFFRTFVLERSGEHEDRLDLKGRGIIPIVDIARLYALAAGVPEVNTIERLRALGGRGDLTLRDARALADAYEFISRLRLEHQGEQLKRGDRPDNYLDPASLSALRRDQLREAFGLVRRAQKALGLKYGHR